MLLSNTLFSCKILNYPTIAVEISLSQKYHLKIETVTSSLEFLLVFEQKSNDDFYNAHKHFFQEENFSLKCNKMENFLRIDDTRRAVVSMT